MFNLNSNPTVTNCTFIGNSASDSHGGGMYNYDASSLSITNTTFIGNAAVTGGGMINVDSTIAATNCTFSGNIALGGGGMVNSLESVPVLTNCIMWGNIPDEILNTDPTEDQPVVSFSNIQGELSLGTIDGGGNIDADPLFVDADGADDILGTEDDNLRLQTMSPCIDAGDNTAIGLVGILTDLDGNGLAPIVNIGAYESQCGNGEIDADEACDDGEESMVCDADCTLAVCDDSTLNITAGEQCDDGGESATCDVDCSVAVCGDGTLNITAGEECDDGNTVSSDGCDSTCQVDIAAIPTVSAWGLIVMTLLLLVAAKTYFRRYAPAKV